MSPEKEKAKELAVHACGGACDGGQERDAVIVNQLMYVLRYLLTFRLAASLSGVSGVSGCERVPLR